MSEKIESTAALSADSLSRSNPAQQAQGTGSSIVVSRTPDGRFWATSKGFLGIGRSESEAIEELARLVAAAGEVIVKKPDTASRPLSSEAHPPAVP
jgi:hypothetical protein